MKCKEKKKFKSRQSAYMAAARVLRQSEYRYIRAYICVYCKQWHLTKQVKRKEIQNEDNNS